VRNTHIFVLWEERQPTATGRSSWTATKHPEDPDLTWFGHSIRKWEGDTLVIDTVGFNDKFWFDRRASAPSTFTIRRWTRKDFGHLENQVTIDDRCLFAALYDHVKWQLWSLARLMECIYQENNQFRSRWRLQFKNRKCRRPATSVTCTPSR
jgi:hypothetical protein